MRMMLNMIGALSLVVYCGCESNVSSTSTAQRGDSAATAPPEPAAPGPGGAARAPASPAPPAAMRQPPAVAAPAVPTPAADPGALNASDEASDDATLKQAQVGVGVKGQGYGGPGFITTPIAAKFRMEERIAFEAQIPNAMKLYKAAHNDKGPATHEEFMEVIIKENGVPLPELAPGETYVYDPKTEELMVRTPQP